MSTELEHEDYKGYRIEIHIDEDPEHADPRDCDNLGTLVFSHKRYKFPNEAEIDFDRFGSWSEVGAYLRKEFDARALTPVFMIDHSGLAFRAGRGFGDVDPQGWDWGQVGWAFISAARLREEFSTKRITKKLEETAQEIVDAEVKAFGSFANGEVYGYLVRDPHGNVVESCWGYVGSDEFEYLRTEGRGHIDWEIGERQKKLDKALTDGLFISLGIA